MRRTLADVETQISNFSRRDAKIAEDAEEERDQGLGTREEEGNVQLSNYAPPLAFFAYPALLREFPQYCIIFYTS
jgi:hypothetical protein